MVPAKVSTLAYAFRVNAIGRELSNVVVVGKGAFRVQRTLMFTLCELMGG